MPDHQPQQATDALRAEIEAEEKRLAEVEKRLAEKRQLLELADRHGYALVKNAAPIPVEALSPWAKPTWNQTMLRILTEAGGWLRHNDLFHRIETSPVYPALTKGYKNFHGTLERLKKRQEIVSHDGVVYLKKTFEELKAKNALIPRQKRPRGPTARRFIMDLLRAHPTGLTAEQIADAMDKSPNAPKRSQMNTARYAQEALAAAVRLGRAVCKDGVYKLPAKIGPLKRMKDARFDGRPSFSKKLRQPQSSGDGNHKKAKGRASGQRSTLQDATLLSGTDPDLSGLH